ncbi:MAG: RsmE family RNA methyltransferase [Acidimicrobiales bacterium]
MGRVPGAPGPELVASAAHVFVQDLGEPRVSGADTHHLSRTLRLRPGELVTAADGAGRWRRCVWRGAGAQLEARLEADGPVVVEERPGPAITVGFALTKGDRPERVVRGLTEVGVDRIVPLVAARSVVRWEAGRAEGHLERLRRVAREAAMQSRRLWLPEVAPLATVIDLVAGLVAGAAPAGPAGAGGPAGALAQPGGLPPSLEHPCVLVGPEGGWDTSELACGLGLVGLGPCVLRAETAALAAGIILCSIRAGVVG